MGDEKTTMVAGGCGGRRKTTVVAVGLQSERKDHGGGRGVAVGEEGMHYIDHSRSDVMFCSRQQLPANRKMYLNISIKLQS